MDRVGRFLAALPDFMVIHLKAIRHIFYQRQRIAFKSSKLFRQTLIFDLNLYSLISQDTISILHNATTAGIVPVVQELMSSERLALSRDQYGATPLHKAVLFYQPKLVKLISEKFPLTTKAKDQEGRTPLHYAAALHDSGIFYRYLLKCGADELIQDKVYFLIKKSSQMIYNFPPSMLRQPSITSTLLKILI